MQERKSAAEYREMVGLDRPQPARSKHNAKRTECGGRTYASMLVSQILYEFNSEERNLSHLTLGDAVHQMRHTYIKGK